MGSTSYSLEYTLLLDTIRTFVESRNQVFKAIDWDLEY